MEYGRKSAISVMQGALNILNEKQNEVSKEILEEMKKMSFAVRLSDSDRYNIIMLADKLRMLNVLRALIQRDDMLSYTQFYLLNDMENLEKALKYIEDDIGYNKLEVELDHSTFEKDITISFKEIASHLLWKEVEHFIRKQDYEVDFIGTTQLLIYTRVSDVKLNMISVPLKLRDMDCRVYKKGYWFKDIKEGRTFEAVDTEDNRRIIEAEYKD